MISTIVSRLHCYINIFYHFFLKDESSVSEIAYASETCVQTRRDFKAIIVRFTAPVFPGNEQYRGQNQSIRGTSTPFLRMELVSCTFVPTTCPINTCSIIHRKNKVRKMKCLQERQPLHEVLESALNRFAYSARPWPCCPPTPLKKRQMMPDWWLNLCFPTSRRSGTTEGLDPPQTFPTLTGSWTQHRTQRQEIRNNLKKTALISTYWKIVSLGLFFLERLYSKCWTIWPGCNYLHIVVQALEAVTDYSIVMS